MYLYCVCDSRGMKSSRFVTVLICSTLFHFSTTIKCVEENLGLCSEPSCTNVISSGVTLSSYSTPDESGISFEHGQEVLIFVKKYGSKRNRLGIMINKKKGYVGHNLIQERKVFVKEEALVPATVDFRLDVNYESKSYSQSSPSVEVRDNSGNQPNLSPMVSQYHEVTDIYQSQSKLPIMDASENEIINHKPSVNIGILQGSIKVPDVPSQEALDQAFTKSSKIVHSDQVSSDRVNPTNQLDSSIQEHSVDAFQSLNFDDSLNPDSQSGHTSFHLGNLQHTVKANSQFLRNQEKADPFDYLNSGINSDDLTTSNNEISPDVSETMAMLKKRGIEDSDLTGNYNSETSNFINKNAFSSHNAHNIPHIKPSYVHSNSLKNAHKAPGDISSAELGLNALHSINKGGGMKETDSASSVSFHENVNHEVSDEEDIEDGEDEEGTEDGDELESNSIAEDIEVHPTESIPVAPSFHKTDLPSHTNSRSKAALPTQVSDKNPSVETSKHDSISEHDNLKASHTEEIIITTSNTLNFDFSDAKGHTVDPNVNNWIAGSQSGKIPLSENTDQIKHDSSITIDSTAKPNIFEENLYELNLTKENELGEVPYVKSKDEDDEKIDESGPNAFELGNNSLIDKEAEILPSSNGFESQQSETTFDLTVEPYKSPVFETEAYKNIKDKPYSNPALTENSNPALTGNSNPALTENSNPALTENSNPALTENSNPALTENSNPALTENSDPALTENSNPIEDNLLNKAEDFEENHSNSYQVRDLKGESLLSEDSNSEFEEDQKSSDYTFDNFIAGIRAFTEVVMMMIPEPAYSYIIDFDKQGIPPRAIVFTAISAVPCVVLFITYIYIRERSKDKKLSDQLLVAEKHLHSLSAEKQVLEDKLQTVTTELSTLHLNFEKEKELFKDLNYKLNCSQEQLQDTDTEFKNSLKTIDFFQKKEDEYLSALTALQKEKNDLSEQNENLEKRLKEEEDSVSSLATQLQELEEEVKKYEEEKETFIQAELENEGKISQLQLNCKQLLEEAEVWNMRVTELNDQLSKEKILKEESESLVKTQETEIESLKHAIKAIESFGSSSSSEGSDSKSMEEKISLLMDTSHIKIQLQQEQEEKEALLEKLGIEKNKILGFEVELIETRSEVTKLKNSYNQALQDKAEAQTKLDVLSNYFKDKEIQLQKQLGAQEAVRQQTENDASSAERRICLIEEENISYKFQVASMKQEMEETERNLKNQIAAQEKKAHENWLAARAAERKFEEVKQEASQLQQRLTLFERESEAYANSAHDDVIRPVPKRFPGPNEKAINTLDDNPSSMDMRFGGFEPHIPPPPPLMLPRDRPLPPLLPPLPAFLPHLDPGMPPPFRPWHINSDSEFHPSPPDYIRGRESTPPRGHPSLVHDRDAGPHTSSPMSASDMKDSRNSTPPHALPHFHDIPPQPPMGYFAPPPPMHFSRFPLPPPFRREHQGPRHTDIRSTDINASQTSHQQSPSPSDRWQHPNSQV